MVDAKGGYLGIGKENHPPETHQPARHRPPPPRCNLLKHDACATSGPMALDERAGEEKKKSRVLLDGRAAGRTSQDDASQRTAGE